MVATFVNPLYNNQIRAVSISIPLYTGQFVIGRKLKDLSHGGFETCNVIINYDHSTVHKNRAHKNSLLQSRNSPCYTV